MHPNQLRDCREILIAYACAAGVVFVAFLATATVGVLSQVSGTLT